MKIKVLGSGGCVPLPLPTCFCHVCEEARNKGVPYSRGGCSIFVEDINTLVDTPEDSINVLNRERISKVDNILYSHWDPDHTLGMRVIEALKLRWLDLLVKGEKNKDKINVYALKEVIEDLKAIKNKFGSYLDYYEGQKLICINEVNEFKSVSIGSFKITFVPVNNDGVATVFIIENEGKKLIYAPCDIKPFPIKLDVIKNADMLILGNVIPDEPLKDEYSIPNDNVMKRIMFTINEVIDIRKSINAKEVIITHIEEDWGKSFDDYIRLEEKYKEHNIKFAYDGMQIEII